MIEKWLNRLQELLIIYQQKKESEPMEGAPIEQSDNGVASIRLTRLTKERKRQWKLKR
jgi:hypothetical protein